MSQTLLLNPDPKQIGPYVVQFVGSELHIAPASEPGQALVCLDGETALELIDWLGLSRPQLFMTVMRDGLEAFKAQIRAEFHLPEPEEPEPRAIYISPGSVDETLVALTRAAAVTPICNLCLQRFCPDCYNCHNRGCRHYYPCDCSPQS